MQDRRTQWTDEQMAIIEKNLLAGVKESAKGEEAFREWWRKTIKPLHPRPSSPENASASQPAQS